MISALARQLMRAARARGREAFFAREMRTPEMQAAASVLANDLRRQPGAEHVVLGRNGEVTARVSSGDPTRVILPPNLDAGRRTFMAHNHPRESEPADLMAMGNRDSPLSPMDLRMAGAYTNTYGEQGWERIAALLSTGGDLHRMGSVARITPRGRKHMPRKEVMQFLDALRSELGKAYTEPHMRGRGHHYAEAANRAFARTGLLRYGSRYPDNTTARMTKDDAAMALIEDQLTRMLHKPVFGLPYPFRWSQIGAGGAALGAGAAGYAAGRTQRNRRRRNARR